MNIETERLLIRSIQPEDTEAYTEMASDGSLDRDIFPGRGKNYAAWMGEWIAEAIRAEEENDPTNWLAYAVAEKDSMRTVGSIGASFNPDFEALGLVYFIGTKHRGRGYAAEAAAAFSAHLLKKYALPKILTTVREENKASVKTIEKAGFILTEETMYQDYFDDKPYAYRLYEMKA